MESGKNGGNCGVIEMDYVNKIYLEFIVWFWLLMGFSAKNTAELEAHLSKNATLTEGGQPGPTDAHIALQITGTPLYT